MKSIALLIAALTAVSVHGAVPSDIARLSRAEAVGRPETVVTGVVTLVTTWLPSSGIVADVEDPNGRGIYFSGFRDGLPERRGFEELKSGDVLEMRGLVDPLLAEPGLVVSSLVWLAHHDLPSPPRVSVAVQNDRHWANRRARVRGWVRSVRARPTQTGKLQSVDLDTGRGMITVSTGQAELCDPSLVGELVDIDGVFLHVIRIGGELLSIELETDSSAAIRPVGPWMRRWAVVSRLMKTAGWYLILPLLVGIVWLLHEKRSVRTRNAALSAERRRIANELHDTVAQHISGAKMMLCSLRLADRTHDEEYAMLGGTLEAAWREVRDAIYGLKNDEMMALGLGAILSAYAERTNALGGVKVAVELADAPDFTAQAKIDLLAIVQEATGNAVRHGGAKHVQIDGRRLEDGRFRLTVVSDGAPFDVAHAPGPEEGHFGLSGMRERAERAGFVFFIGCDGDNRVFVQLEERK